MKLKLGATRYAAILLIGLASTVAATSAHAQSPDVIGICKADEMLEATYRQLPHEREEARRFEALTEDFMRHGALAVPPPEWVTHEFGHWLNLKHTFVGGCTGDGDKVSDTPPESKSVQSSCTGSTDCGGKAVNAENYMGYTGARRKCYKMFTKGQVARMRAALEHPARKPLWQPANLIATGVDPGRPTAPRIAYAGSTFFESPNNDGSISGELHISAVRGVRFAVPGGDLIAGVHYTTVNVPPGLTVQISVRSGLEGTVRLLGNAPAHAAVNSVSNLTITFLDAAVIGKISPTYQTNSNLKISFDDPPTKFCTPASRFATYVHITGFQLGTINASSAYDNGHANRVNSHVTDLQPGQTYTATVTASKGNSGPMDPAKIRIWVDWDGNFVLEPGELAADHSFNVSSSNPSGEYTYSAPITVPANAAAGRIGLRARAYYALDTMGGPCDEVDSGEAEDYGLNIGGTAPIWSDGGLGPFAGPRGETLPHPSAGCTVAPHSQGHSAWLGALCLGLGWLWRRRARFDRCRPHNQGTGS